MKILSLNKVSAQKAAPSFKSNLVTDKAIAVIIAPNREAFVNAAKKYDSWLQNDQANVHDTVFIRPNSSLTPNVAIEHDVQETTYAYPFEESGYTHTVRKKEFEDLEFQLGNKVCGFWFNPKSSENKYLEDFKNMFEHLKNK